MALLVSDLALQSIFTNVATLARKKNVLLLDNERQALTRIAAGNPLSEVLDELGAGRRGVLRHSDSGFDTGPRQGWRRLLHGVAPSLLKANGCAVHRCEVAPRCAGFATSMAGVRLGSWTKAIAREPR